MSEILPVELAGALLGFLLTLSVFSYLLGDNFLFRLAIHIFIGVSAGFAAVVVWYNVIWPQLIAPMISGSQPDRLLLLVPLILSLLLLAKASPRLSALGTPALAYLVGVGAAVAVGGALFGTIFPQVSASINQFDMEAARQSSAGTGLFLVNGILSLVGTLATLVYFQFGSRPAQGRSQPGPSWLESIALIGRGFIAITFGTLFAGAIAAAMVALIERWDFMIKFILSFFS
ncbi:MAG: hypothetical protein JXB15_14265 [Anaerolineales bacterium]|nr:hypothetical protein [Anaerolineales bacterium]